MKQIILLQTFIIALVFKHKRYLSVCKVDECYVKYPSNVQISVLQM